MVFAAACLTAASDARAFCGFYVSGAGSELYNNATQVVLMRDGTRTVLSMSNNYQGPPDDFALVIPVPVVLQTDNVKTLPRELLTKIDSLDAPRLVEYWEQDPCNPGYGWDFGGGRGKMSNKKSGGGGGDDKDSDYGVTVEAQFTVGEYEVVILSARDSTGLDAWLRDGSYKIPAGAEPFLRPYVEGGMKFFVAKVNAKKVKFENGMATLSPLRFHYDSEEFTLPMRLGLMNSSGTQDLIVHILAPEYRYEAANYDNVTIPTNLDVDESVRDNFGGFYAALFDRTVATHPLAVVTEYSWDAGSCDPCPIPPLEAGELATLGADVLPDADVYASFVLTRLHMRYPKDFAGDDLVFRKAQPIAGGREMLDEFDKLEKRSVYDDYNNFQGRYVIRHPWTGPIACEEPERGVWGGPPPKPGQDPDDEDPGEPPAPMAAIKLAFAPRDSVALTTAVREDVPEIGLTGGRLLAVPGTAPPATTPPATPGQVAPQSSKGCGCRAGDRESGVGFLLLGLLVMGAVRRRTVTNRGSRL